MWATRRFMLLLLKKRLFVLYNQILKCVQNSIELTKHFGLPPIMKCLMIACVEKLSDFQTGVLQIFLAQWNIYKLLHVPIIGNMHGNAVWGNSGKKRKTVFLVLTFSCVNREALYNWVKRYIELIIAWLW